MKLRFVCAPAVVCALAAASVASASDPNACDLPGEAPNLIVGDLPSAFWWGRVGEISGYAFQSTTCNLGTCWVDWFASNEHHPVFTVNLYRLEDGRFEQIGMSWVRHRYFALSSAACTEGCIPTDGQHLGVRCSTTNSASGNGQQGALGPRSEVDASTGTFPFPHGAQGATGDAIYKRLQVHDADLDPAAHAGAAYFVEGIELAADDAAAGNAFDNVSHREVWVAPAGGHFALSVTGATAQGKAAIQAWAARDPEVVLSGVDVAGDGRFHVGSRATPLGDGRWSYEYAVENLDSHRSARRLAVHLPEGAVVEDVGFHDVDYHSGESYSGADWTASVDSPEAPGAIAWATPTFDENPLANALRWGTTYNFRFVVEAPPATGQVELGLFRPGEPGSVAATAVVPRVCDGDGVCDPGEDCGGCPSDCLGPTGACCGDSVCDPAEDPCGCAGDCGPPPPIEIACRDGRDDDCDGRADCLDDDCCAVSPCDQVDDDGDGFLSCEDCDDADAEVWATPDEVSELALEPGADGTWIGWTAPSDPGAESPGYELLRSASPALSGAVCLGIDDPEARETSDPDLPPASGLFVYLVRAVNSCPGGEGSLGEGDAEGSREVAGCP